MTYHGRTMITCDIWRLTAEAPEVWLGYWPAAKRIRSFYALCMIYQASFCSICFQRTGFAFPDQSSASSSYIHREAPTRKVIYKSIIFVGKLMALFLHSIASLVMSECARASLIFTSSTDVPSLVRVEPKYLNWYTSSSVCLDCHINLN